MADLPSLIKLKDYLATPAGCVGGNIAGKNWLFGIEFGGKAELVHYQNLTIDHAHKYWKQEDIGTFTNSYAYNQRIAKFEAVKHGWAIEDYTDFAIQASMLNKEGEYYRGNIGAVGFKHDNETTFEEIGKYLGLESKQQLKDIEDSSRSPMFRKWLAEYNPNCICCFGSTSAARFVKIFTTEPTKSDCWRKLDRNWYYHDVINQGKTNLFVLPHPTAGGGQGLSSHHKIQIFGKMVRDTMIAGGFEVF